MTIKMTYEVIILGHLHMPLYFIGTFTEYPYLYVNPIQVCLLLIEQAIREGICADDVVKLSVILNVIFF
ncbi:hypothetical protein [Odoribacter splanchnicus]|uniref:hypothetical protein n=1 Tax=Odoribacter splanchnicus TaxID=28118 RepID=UPI0036F449C7